MKMRKLRRRQAAKPRSSRVWLRRLPLELIGLGEAYRALADAIEAYMDMRYSKTNGMGF